jgi:transglutaminase-like putative cysteine protease
MNIRLYHRTEYFFSDPVFLEPHTLKFKARQNPGHVLQSYNLTINPAPSGRYEFLDESGNFSEMVWFNNLNTRLILEAESSIKIGNRNPFNYLIYPFKYSQMPVKYSSTSGLDKYIKTIDNQINTYNYLKQLIKNNRGNTMDFLLMVTGILHTDFEKTVRHNGPPHTPDVTLKRKKGSCRDLAVLEMEMLRKSGFATRFVSGYKFNEENDEDPELHAWVEVYIPGPGWIGLDPSTGLMAGNDHIPVSSSFLPVNTLPVSGTFRGKAESEMKTKILIEKVE